VTIAAAAQAEIQAARVLAAEMQRRHHLIARLRTTPPATIHLALGGTPRATALLTKAAGTAAYSAAASEEKYLLETGPAGVTIVAETPRGLLYGIQTLLQMIRPGRDGNYIAGARIVDYPQLGFRGLHVCIFPNTELPAVRQAILTAARFKYNAVVIETWASLKSKKRPETAYEQAYTADQLRPLINLGKALHMDMIPMLNSWGHASGMRAGSAQHVVLDRFPQFKPLYEEDGWSFCLTNPAIYGHLFDRYSELLELFGKPKYFHLGLDEAWGHLGLVRSDACRGPDPPATAAAHLKKLYSYFAQRNIRVMVWHDMLLERDHPQLGRLSPANSLPAFNTHLVLDHLPRDIIIAAWNYSATSDWPVPKYFRDKGFPVIVSPWKVRRNAEAMVNLAKKLDLVGLLQTTWDSLDVTLPTVGEAGVAAWAPPGFVLDSIPYQSFLRALREFPICELPRLELTLPEAGQ